MSETMPNDADSRQWQVDNSDNTADTGFAIIKVELHCLPAAVLTVVCPIKINELTPMLTFMQLAEDGEKLGGPAKACQDFPQSLRADSIKGLGQVYESCI